MRLDDYQRSAVEARGRVTSVVASAGAGKTSVLVERYLRHVVEDGWGPGSILTMTFTVKAAAEMKQRIVGRLVGLGLRDAAQEAETGPIGTIHSFCQRLIQENALLAGVDPDFELVTAPETDLIWAEAFGEALVGEMSERAEVRSLKRMLAGKRGYQTPGTLEGELKRAVVDGFVGRFRGSSWDLEELWDVYESRESYGSALVEELFQWMGGEPRLGLEEHAKSSDVVGFLEAAQAAYAGRRHAKSRPSWLGTRRDAERWAEAFDHSLAVAWLGLEAWSGYEARLRRRNQKDFALLESTAVGLVSESPSVREKLRRRYRALLVDETQDVNPMQYALIDALDLEATFLVGDKQQSIFGFRQADPSLFESRTREGAVRLARNYRSSRGVLGFVNFVFESLWGPEYRAMEGEDGVLEDGAAGSGKDRFAGVEVWPMGGFEPRLVVAGVGELLSEGVRRGDMAILVKKNSAAQQISGALEARGIPHQVVGGTQKFYARMETRDVANLLRAAESPWDDFALACLLHSPFAGLSLDSVVLLSGGKREGPARLFEKISGEWSELVVAGDVGALEGFCEWFLPLAAGADRMAAWEVLSEALHRSPYLATVARRNRSTQTLANIRKLLSLAAKEPDLGPRAFAERVQHIQELGHKEGDAPVVEEGEDVVTVMTIHKSKGLEFGTVVFADVFNGMGRQRSNCRSDLETGFVTTQFRAGTSYPAHDWLGEQLSEEGRAEELRLLYVALTRAKERLCVALPEVSGEGEAGTKPRNRGETYGSLLSQVLDWPDGLDDGIRVRRPEGKVER